MVGGLFKPTSFAGLVSALGSHGYPFCDAAMVSDRFRPVAAVLQL